MERQEYLKEKKFKLQCELNSQNNFDIARKKVIQSKINDIDFELNAKKDNVKSEVAKENARNILDTIRFNRK